MRRPRRNPLAWPLLLCGVVVLGAGAGRALTASAVPPASRAGAGSVASTGFTVSGVSFTLNSSSPQNLDSVAFTLGPVAAGTVQIKISGNVYTCSGTTSITCATTSPQATAASADTSDLVVVAAQ